MPKCARLILPVLMLLLVASCSTTKFVPEDRLLLNKMRVHITDAKEVNATHYKIPSAYDSDALSSKMKGYVRQKNNSEILGFWKLQLELYSLAGKDTSKWINRTIQKMGEAPEIFDPSLAEASLVQIKRGMENKGYFNAAVDTTMEVKKRRLKLTYEITAGKPYTIRSYKVHLQQSDLKRYATNERFMNVHEGDLFDADLLDTERDRITRGMRRNGYYYFEKEDLCYVVDSALNSNEVTVEMKLRDYITSAPDSLREKLFTQFTIRNVNFFTDYDLTHTPDSVQLIRTQEEGYTFSHTGKKLLRDRVLKRNCFVVPGELYNIATVERTYASLNALGPVKYVDISFEVVGPDQLDCNVVLSRGKLNSVSAQIEGTYSAGDWGVGGGVGYSNRNLFRGAEELSINGSASYEWRQNGGRAIEATAEASIQFTNAPKVLIGYKYQNRPDEFTRTIANASLTYTYKKYRSNWTHRFNLVDISYVYLPWISDEFRDMFLKPTNLLRYSYQDHFIVDWSYGGNYSSYNSRNPYRSYSTFNYQVETAGNLLYGISKIFDLPQDEDGAYKIFNIRYAQYAKADVNWAYHQIFNKQHRLVYHAALGVAVPFLNASSIPFEKRYFAGGANSVRGWQVRSLGPGGYRGSGDRIDYNNQSGDIKLDLNLEYRWRVWSIFELAAFTDAGNIWTIRDYELQPHGVFSKDFYKQIAWSYGVGLRLDFSFFVFRVDFGVKLYDPSRLYYDQKEWRTVKNGLGWKDDMTFHFAIGYPF